MCRVELIVVLPLALLCLGQAPVTPPAAPAPSEARMAEFLRKGRIVHTAPIAKGITGSIRATLVHGDLRHDAQIQTIDDTRREFKSKHGTELNFRDSWQFNIAAYELDRLLDLQLVPVTVERRWNGTAGSFTWWVDDVLMDEGERIKRDMSPPDSSCWHEQMRLMRLFDQLIENTDRNAGNLLITRTWRVWAIDHTRAFRRSSTLKQPAMLTHADRRVLQRLAALQFDPLQHKLGRYLTGHEIRALLSRRNAIIAHFSARGEPALFDRRRDLSAGCGVGSA